MTSKKSFWRSLEVAPFTSGVSLAWEEETGEHFRFTQSLLHPNGRTARCYPTPKPFGEMLAVIHHKEGDIVAVDQQDYDIELPLTEQDIVLYVLDFNALRKRLAKAFELETAKTAIDIYCNDILIATWTPWRGVRLPVRLLLPRGQRHLEEIVRKRIIDQDAQAELLLTPSKRDWSPELEEMARRRQMLLVPLDEVLSIDGERLSMNDAWQEYVQAFFQLAEVACPTSHARKRPRRRRAEMQAKIELLQKAIVDHIRAARDHAYTTGDQGDIQLLPRPTKKLLGAQVGLQPYDVTRCFQDNAQLNRLYDMANNLEDVMRYGR